MRAGQFQKGHPGYWKGKTISKETRAKMSLARIGKKGIIPNAETRKKMSEIASTKVGEKGRNWKGGIFVNDKKGYRRKKRQEYIERGTAWKLTHPEEYKKSNLANTRKWRNKNREYANFLARRRLHLKKNAEGSYTFEDWERIKAEANHSCKHCGKQEPEIRLSVDHVVALSRGGSNYPGNLQPLCISCNSKKGNR